MKSAYTDAEFSEWALTVTGSRLTEAQKLLAGPLADAEPLTNTITQFNEGRLNMINMMIFDGRGRFGGENIEGKAVAHRNEAVLNGRVYTTCSLWQRRQFRRELSLEQVLWASRFTQLGRQLSILKTDTNE